MLGLMPIALDVLLSVLLIAIGFIVFINVLNDYRLTSIVKRLVSKSVSVSLAAYNRNIIISTLIEDFVRGHVRLINARFRDSSLGSASVSGGDIQVSLSKIPQGDVELEVIVEVRGRLDDYWVRGRVILRPQE